MLIDIRSDVFFEVIGEEIEEVLTVLAFLLRCVMIIVHVLLNSHLEIVIQILHFHVLGHLRHALLILCILTIQILDDITNRTKHHTKHRTSNDHKNNGV